MNNQRGGTLLGMALGLVVGVLISFGVVWFLNKTPVPFIDKAPHPDQIKDNSGTDKPPVALPGKPGDNPIERTGDRKFDFYDILEGKKGATPQTGSVPAATSTTPASTSTDTKGETLYLQVGAFKKLEDAENLKARIAMQGFEATVLKVEVPEKGTMHRVRIGPYDDTETMNRARGQLSQNGIPATVVRGKD